MKFAYLTETSPKSLRETLAVAQYALAELGRARPEYRAGGSITHHIAVISQLIKWIDVMRPLGTDGKHGSRHTQVCGCRR